MTRMHTLIALAVVPLAVAVAVLPFVTSSQAVTKRLLVSSSADGPFRDHLSGSLFKGEGPFVPLDRAESTFYIENNSQQFARATVAVVNPDTSSDFEDALTFELDIGGTTAGGAMSLPGSDDCTLVATGPSIQPGGRQAVDISMAAGDLENQVGMKQAASLDFVVTLTQTGEDGLVEVCGEQTDADADADADVDVDVRGDQCQRDVVVTAMGDPTCVPTAVDAGTTYGGQEPRDPAAVAGLTGLLIAVGAFLVLWTGRRRATT